MPWEDEDAGEGFQAPLPPEDRLWRHPAEVAAARRAAATIVPTTTVATFRTPVRQAVGLALIGAAGGALVVTGLFLSLRTAPEPARPVTQSIALDPVVPRPIVVDLEDWPAKVAEQSTEGIAVVTATRDARVHIGSAVVYRGEGLLLTSHDLVVDAEQLRVTTSDGTRHVGELVGTDEISGLAVLRIEENDLPIAPLDVWSQPVVGQHALVLSASASVDELEMTTVTELDVQVPRTPTLSLHGMLELADGLPPGGDGGAVLDTRGAVIGIALAGDADNATYAVPIAFARKIADDISKSGTGRHPWMGIRGIDLSMDDQIELGLVGGVEVTRVIGEPAEKAGLERGDVITMLGDERIGSLTDLILVLRQHPPGRVLTLHFERDGEHHESEVELQLRQNDGST